MDGIGVHVKVGVGFCKLSLQPVNNLDRKMVVGFQHTLADLYLEMISPGSGIL